jgi:rhodanese-related sulfurtransferase
MITNFVAMQNITVEELKNRLSAGEKVNLVDVREPHENADFNIGGTLYPLGKIQTMNVEELEDLKDEELICYCRSGNRSGQACLILDTIGFKNTKNLVGGMLAWEERFGRVK